MPVKPQTTRHLSVADVLDLTVSEAADLFRHDRDVIRALQPIIDVGLDYVKLGQPVPTLSGGEAQRLKLAGFLAEAARTKAPTLPAARGSLPPEGADRPWGGPAASRSAASRQALARKGTLFMFDEPTTGLHFDDIKKLLHVLNQLVDKGNTVLIIEHNLDVIKSVDWIIDLGPEGGDQGGEIVAVGTPKEVAKNKKSYTGQYLAKIL